MTASPRPPGAFVHGHDGPVAVVPGRAAAWLERHAQLRQLRGTDPEIDAVLIALRVAAAAWRTTATGSPAATRPEPAARSPWLTTTQAAGLLGITDRGIRNAIATGRLTAQQQPDGRWRISREDAEHYRAARRRAA